MVGIYIKDTTIENVALYVSQLKNRLSTCSLYCFENTEKLLGVLKLSSGKFEDQLYK